MPYLILDFMIVLHALMKFHIKKQDAVCVGVI